MKQLPVFRKLVQEAADDNDESEDIAKGLARVFAEVGEAYVSLISAGKRPPSWIIPITYQLRHALAMGGRPNRQATNLHCHDMGLLRACRGSCQQPSTCMDGCGSADCTPGTGVPTLPALHADAACQPLMVGAAQSPSVQLLHAQGALPGVLCEAFGCCRWPGSVAAC